jgi:hypothetical protein
VTVCTKKEKAPMPSKFENGTMTMVRLSGNCTVASVPIRRKGRETYQVTGNPEAGDGGGLLPAGQPFWVSETHFDGISHMCGTLCFDASSANTWHLTFHGARTVKLTMAVTNGNPEALYITLCCVELQAAIGNLASHVKLSLMHATSLLASHFAHTVGRLLIKPTPTLFEDEPSGPIGGPLRENGKAHAHSEPF